MGGIVNQIAYFFFVLIVVFLILTNYKGLVEIMKQGGTTLDQVTFTLQGRGSKPPSGY